MNVSFKTEQSFVYYFSHPSDFVNHCISVQDIVKRINKSLDDGTSEETHNLVRKPEGMFPKVLPRSAFLYHDGLFKGKQVCFCLMSY